MAHEWRDAPCRPALTAPLFGFHADAESPLATYPAKPALKPLVRANRLDRVVAVLKFTQCEEVMKLIAAIDAHNDGVTPLFASRDQVMPFEKRR
jgi:hypothetical protein